MAKIQANVSERIFNISNWHGVNEAPEGEARLRLGEAAVMKNFCVTSGGALKKRPGSRNVAELLSAYTIKTEDNSREIFPERSWTERGLRPRAEVREDGTVYASGQEVMADPRTANEKRGWFLEKDGFTWMLDRVDELRPGSGTPLEGGVGIRGNLRAIGSGTVTVDEEKGAEPVYEGNYPTLSVWPGARVKMGVTELKGAPTALKCEKRDEKGFVTENVGGFLFIGGTELWEYYGVEITSVMDLKVPWKKYSGYKMSGGYTWYDRVEYLGTEFYGSEAAIPGDHVGKEVTIGEEYVVVKDGERYFMYTRDREDPRRVGIYKYMWYGYKLTVKESEYSWLFRRAWSESTEYADKQVRGIWSGRVGSRDVICAICGGTLWELKLSEEGVWSKVAAGKMDTSQDIQMFGFDEKLYLLGGEKYMVWDGERLSEVEGYRPLVAVAVAPAGGGTLLENVNRLSTGRRCWFSPDGEGKVFKLPEENIASLDWVRDRRTGQELGYGPDLEAGTITFGSAPERGVNTIEVAWSVKEDARAQVAAMRYAEIYNGAQDTRVFLYGDGSNKAIYSGLDYAGRARADYFPDLYEVAVGDANTPITAMIRHYNKLMAFKPDSAWSIGYDTITLIDGTVTAGFYVTPVNRSIGNCAWGQAQLVQNRPRTLDGQRVDATIRRFDLTKARTFYDKFSHEYFVIGEDGTAVVQNMDVDAWYVYTNLQVTCMINYRDELYYGTRDGYLRHFSDRYFSDNGEAIEARWESGAMSFSEDFRRKYSAMVWIGIKPEDNGYLEVTAQTDRKSDFAVYDVESVKAGAVPEMERIKLKAKKFTYYKLILGNNTADKTCTVVSADMRVRGTGYVR